MAKDYEVQAQSYKGIDIKGIAEEELFKAAIKGLNAWKDNLSTGSGAKGSRKPWVNTGEARADLAINPATPKSLNYTVGGDVVQLFIAEFGRAPNNTMPPLKAIEDWVAEKGIAARGDAEFAGVVYAIRAGIAKNGIKPFAPGLKAGHDSVEGFGHRVQARMQAEIKAASIASWQGTPAAGTKPPRPRRRTP